MSLVACLSGSGQDSPASRAAMLAEAQSDLLIVSADDVRRRLLQPRPRIIVYVPQSVATFRTEIRQTYMVDFQEYLRGLFALNTLQRQSADWASRGNGLNLVTLAKGVQRAWRDHEVAKTRGEIQRELEARQRASDPGKH